ncbi:phosphate signaling complex protein PhoU [Alicyclobacillus vulcanalis]|uniref:Phosphate-specific transport system accessory protein PhoU n=1 Tax=Alicyclobacillus vulcanalis TaxID=252246 RepID=A0A1N7KUU9_9BACL|nr:phosphate signaling complex protein PhoU [Alicyclobacillus vulcanalis]SIS65276.1 phosphate transport system protein [Alicyclobacillus vulcanalis]
MHQRQAFDIALKELKLKLLHMGGDVQESIRHAVAALLKHDEALARRVIERDREINRQDHDIEDLCIRLIATQQPVAGDLRRIVAGMRLAVDLERMGDLAVDLAKTALRLTSAPVPEAAARLQDMASAVDGMVSEGLNAYVNSDADAARRLAEMDDAVDRDYRLLVEGLFADDRHAGCSPQERMFIAFCGRYLERIGDHVTNIGESVLYILTGERSDLN